MASGLLDGVGETPSIFSFAERNCQVMVTQIGRKGETNDVDDMDVHRPYWNRNYGDCGICAVVHFGVPLRPLPQAKFPICRDSNGRVRGSAPGAERVGP
jgi:hypothetical protein